MVFVIYSHIFRFDTYNNRYFSVNKKKLEFEFFIIELAIEIDVRNFNVTANILSVWTLLSSVH